MSTDKSSEREALKPCPFCGAGQTLMKENGKQWLGMRYSEPTSVSVQHWCDPVPGQPSRMVERVGRDEASAIEAWNTRSALPQQAQDIAEASGGAEGGPEEDRIEAAFWRFDARHKGYGEWRQAPMSERDAFKAEMRNALHAEAVRAEMRMVAKGWRKPGPQQAQETSLPPQGAASLLPEPVAAQGCADYLRSLANLCFLHNRQVSGVLREWAAALAASPAPAPQEPDKT